jgi:hypothetical protein
MHLFFLFSFTYFPSFLQLYPLMAGGGGGGEMLEYKSQWIQNISTIDKIYNFPVFPLLQ